MDNLKLGYGGTAREMARLVNESGVLSEAQKINLNDTRHLGEALQEVGFAKIIEAINATQKKMKIMGTTAKEAAGTISGSVGSMKASFQNLLVGVANDTANFPELVNQLVTTVDTALTNLMPRIEIALNGIAELINQLLPVIASRLPSMINSLLPTLLQATVNLFNALFDGIKDLARTLPQLADTALTLMTELLNGMAESLPELVPLIVQTILNIADIFLLHLESIIDVGIKILEALLDGVIEALPMISERVPQIVTKFVETIIKNLPEIIEVGGKIVFNLAKGILQAIPDLVATLPMLVKSLVEGAMEFFADFKNIGYDIGDNIKNGFTEGWNNFVDEVKENIEKVKSMFSNEAQGSTLFGIGGKKGGGSRDFDGSHANGLSYVPKDNYIARLHKGERVLTAEENQAYNKGNGMTINQYIQTVPQTPAEFAFATQATFEEALWAI